MVKIKRINEGIDNIKKVEGKSITYYSLFPLLKGLEVERPGIRDRIWDFLKEERDIQFQPIHGRILGINLFYYGVGDEYPIEDDPKEIAHCKKIHPQAFISGTIENQLRLDFNLIWYVYEVKDLEMFYVITDW